MFILETGDLKVTISAPEQAKQALRSQITDTLGADPGEINADGQFHKFKTGIDLTKGRAGSGSYKFDPSGPVAVFGSHRPDECEFKVVDFDFPGKDGEAWKIQAENIRQEVEAHKAETREKAARKALEKLKEATLLNVDHAYLHSRGVANAAIQYGKLRVDAEGALLVPMVTTAGKPRNVQTIYPDGKKRFLSGGETAGLFLAIPARPESGQPYYLCEGLAKALAVWSATGLTTVCAFSAGNLQRVLTDLGPASAIVAADNDPAGQNAAERCRSQGARVVYPPEGMGDWNDVLTQQGVEALIQLLTIAPHEGPQPLYRRPEPAQPFPLSALGELAIPAKLIADHLNIDPSLVGSSILAATNLAACGTADIYFKSEFIRPMSLFMLTLAESGSGKSPADSILLQPHREIEREWEDQYAIEAPLAKILVDKYLGQKKALEKECKDIDGEEHLKLFKELGPPPLMPMGPHLLIADATLEAFNRVIEMNRPILGSFTDEGGRMLSGWSLSKDHAARTLSGLADFWEAKVVKIIRASPENPTTILRGKRLALHWSVQPYVAEGLFANPMFAEQGFLPRNLITRPALQTPKPFSDHDIGKDPALMTYRQRIRALLTADLSLRKGAVLELEPPHMHLAPNARAHFIAAWDHINLASDEGGELNPIRAFAMKLPDNLLRIAATLAKYHDPETKVIDLRWMQSACELGTFYAREMLRVHAGAVINSDLREAQGLIDWIRSKEHRYVYPSLVYQHGPASLRNKAAAKKIMQLLVDHGHLNPVVTGREVDGKFRQEVFERVDAHV